LEIEAELLNLSKSGATITRLVYGANLNFKLTRKHLQRMMNKGKIEKTGRLYTATEKGLKFLRLVEQLL